MTFTHELFAESDKYYCFSGNPIAITTKMDTNQFATDATFTQVVLVVDINGKRHEFPSDIANGESVTIDVSTAWLTEYAKKEGGLESLMSGYDVEIGNVYAYTKFLPKNSLYVERSSEVSVISNVYALNGSVADFDVIKNKLTQPSAINKYRTRLSTKPGGEVIGLGETMISSTYTKGTTIVTTKMSKTSKVGVVTGTDVYVEDNDMRKEFWFVNRFGVIENASAVVLESMSIKPTAKTIKVVGKPSFTPNQRMIKSVSSQPCKMKMSSGYLTREWVKWWAEEFLGSKEVWMNVGDVHIPVSVESDEEVTIYDKTKGELMAVNFTVTPGIDGLLDM